jgi:hypothetical protein
MSTGTLGQRFLRSVQIERDWQSRDVIAHYVPTLQVRQVLRRLGDALANGATDRAWTLTGPTGRENRCLPRSRSSSYPQSMPLRVRRGVFYACTIPS